LISLGIGAEFERFISVAGGFQIADLDWPGIICSGSGFETARENHINPYPSGSNSSNRTESWTEA
jgi:hypothetical protein